MSGQLHPFAFEIRHRDGAISMKTFYAPPDSVARQYARSWARERGHTVAVQASQRATTAA